MKTQRRASLRISGIRNSKRLTNQKQIDNSAAASKEETKSPKRNESHISSRVDKAPQVLSRGKKRKVNESASNFENSKVKVEEIEFVGDDLKTFEKMKNVNGDGFKVEDSESDAENDEEFEHFDSSSHSKDHVSEYEIMRLENIKRNMEMLKQFSVVEAKESFDATRKKLPVVGLISYKREKKPKEILPRRKSLRLMKIQADTVKLPTYTDLPQFEYLERKEEKLEMKLENQVGDEHFKKSRLSWINISKELSETKINETDFGEEMLSYKKKILSLQVTHIGKVTKTRAFSVVVHPSKVKTLVCTGDKSGAVGVWDVNANSGKDEVFLFQPHSRPINCLKFSPTDKTKLYSCSYDGTLRCGDFNKEDFSQVYGLDDERFNYFSWPAGKSNTMLTALNTGELLVIDLLTGKAEQRCQLYNKSMRCVDCHPVNEHLFAASFYDGTLSTWDMRMLKKNGNKNLSSFRAMKAIITSFFSPKTGNKVLMTSQDDHIRIFDVNSNGIISTPPRHPIRHHNYYGRWLTTFRASWDPKTDNCFTCGSMVQPRQVDVFGCDKSGNLLSFPLKDESFNHISSVNVFHPTRDILVSSNSTGKLYIWS